MKRIAFIFAFLVANHGLVGCSSSNSSDANVPLLNPAANTSQTTDVDASPSPAQATHELSPFDLHFSLRDNFAFTVSCRSFPQHYSGMMLYGVDLEITAKRGDDHQFRGSITTFHATYPKKYITGWQEKGVKARQVGEVTYPEYLLDFSDLLKNDFVKDFRTNLFKGREPGGVKEVDKVELDFIPHDNGIVLGIELKFVKGTQTQVHAPYTWPAGWLISTPGVNSASSYAGLFEAPANTYCRFLPL